MKKSQDEDLQKLVLESQKETLRKEQMYEKQKNQFPKLFIWFLTICLFLNTIAFLPEKFSLPAIKFLKTSAQLSNQPDIQQYKQTVVSIASDSLHETGFSISNNGKIITNYYVIEENNKVNVSFPNKGLYSAQAVKTLPSIDLAILQIEKDEYESFSQISRKS